MCFSSSIQRTNCWFLIGSSKGFLFNYAKLVGFLKLQGDKKKRCITQLMDVDLAKRLVVFYSPRYSHWLPFLNGETSDFIMQILSKVIWSNSPPPPTRRLDHRATFFYLAYFWVFQEIVHEPRVMRESFDKFLSAKHFECGNSWAATANVLTVATHFGYRASEPPHNRIVIAK